MLYRTPFSHFLYFFFNDTATTEIYTLSLHDALPISFGGEANGGRCVARREGIRFRCRAGRRHGKDRKSTRLNSSHVAISYAVFCLKKKKNPSWAHGFELSTLLYLCGSIPFCCRYSLQDLIIDCLFTITPITCF